MVVKGAGVFVIVNPQTLACQPVTEFYVFIGRIGELFIEQASGEKKFSFQRDIARIEKPEVGSFATDKGVTELSTRLLDPPHKKRHRQLRRPGDKPPYRFIAPRIAVMPLEVLLKQ